MLTDFFRFQTLLCYGNCLLVPCMYYCVPGTVSPVCITVVQELSHLYVLLCSRNCLTCMYYCVPGTVSPVCITVVQELSHLYVLLCSRNCPTCMYYCVPGTVSPVCITVFQEPSHRERGALPELIQEDMAVMNDFELMGLCKQFPVSLLQQIVQMIGLTHRWLMHPLAPAENPPRSCSCARMRPLGNHGAMFVLKLFRACEYKR